MPTYEYICRACGHEFEEFQSIKADPIAVCPKCRKKKVERKIGIGGAVIFKGGGFYETDYRSESYRSGEEAEKKSGESTAQGNTGPNTGSKTESKTGSKTGSRTESRTESKTGSRTESNTDAKTDATPGAKTQPKSDGKPDSTTHSRIESKTSQRPGATAESTNASKPDAAAAAENKRIEARATHQSRIGRGIGNILAKGGKKPAVSKGRLRKK